MEAMIIPFKKHTAENRKCSFCGTKEPKVKIVTTNNLDGSELRCICISCLKEATLRLQEEN